MCRINTPTYDESDYEFRTGSTATLWISSARAKAVDPSRSCIVQAPAGSGKTTLLVQRYLNLLERVNRPEEILAITFTRKAATEMKQRILSALETDNPVAMRVRQRDATAGWGLRLNPNRLKVQTIDSFATEMLPEFRSKAVWQA